MKNYANYEEFYIGRKLYDYNRKIEVLKSLLENEKHELYWGEESALTEAQHEAYKNNFEKFTKLANKQIIREEVKREEKKQQILNELEEIKSYGTLKELHIDVEWYRHATWGYNPVATVKARFENGWKYANDSASGCGYDKESSAIGGALNQILQGFFIEYFKELTSKHYYGVSYGYFEGGVGTSCFTRMFKELGFEVIEHHGKRFESYIITKGA